MGSGFQTGTDTVSRATRIFKIWIPGKTFARDGVITYENDSQQVKFFDYHFMLYAYSNFDTGAGAASYFVGRLNDCHIKMFYKDA